MKNRISKIAFLKIPFSFSKSFSKFQKSFSEIFENSCSTHLSLCAQILSAATLNVIFLDFFWTPAPHPMLLSECYEARGKTAHFQRNSIKISNKDDYVRLKSGHDGGHSDPFFRLSSIFQLIFNIDLILIIRSFRANVFTHPRTPIQCWWNLLILPQGTRHFREDAIVHLTATRHAWRARAYPMMKAAIRCHENVISRFYKNSYTAKI